MKTALGIILSTFLFIGGVFIYDHFVNAPLGADFALEGSNGKIITQNEVRAKPAAIFFGYTRCPDICPATLIDLAGWLDALGPDADKIGVWFVTVDPERDSPTSLREYLANFTDKIIGLSGQPDAVRALAASFKIVANKIEDGEGDYTYDHTAAIILLKKGGKFAGVIPYDRQETKNELKDQIAIERLKNLVNS